MHKKLLASDWDGTLYRHSTISQEDIRAIKKFRQQGHYFALCTGRTPNSIRHALQDFPDLEVDGLILASGGAIYHATQQYPIEIKEDTSIWIPASDATECIRHFHLTGKYDVLWTTKDHSYCLFLERDFAVEKHYHLTHLSLEEWGKSPENIISMGLVSQTRHHQDAIAAVDVINHRWKNTMTAFCNLFFVDVSAAGVHKGTGIKNLTRLLETTYTCYAIGDAQNDIPMFEEVGKENSFRMAEGVAGLDVLASRAVKSVAECIEQLLEDS
ncbi:MAG: HAD-IIB family hydrolase [Brevinema sp.]